MKPKMGIVADCLGYNKSKTNRFFEMLFSPAAARLVLRRCVLRAPRALNPSVLQQKPSVRHCVQSESIGAPLNPSDARADALWCAHSLKLAPKM